ncbi:MAG: peptidoglycan-binding protein, partial [Chitinophagaceae bacterium]
MQKSHYKQELTISATQKRKGAANKKADVLKIQSWLTLFELLKPGSGTLTGMDGDFGPATEKAVINFQKAKGITQNGVVDAALFSQLCAPMKKAFETTPTGNGLRQRILSAAKLHVENSPYELRIDSQTNSGPWVRSYMNGQEGEDWLWCMGFVQTIIDQAASSLNKNFKDLMPLTFSCDTVGNLGVSKGLLTRFAKVRQDPSKVKPGDIFLIQKSEQDWIHTGIIVSVGNDIFETIEGNTNSDGSSNGNRACKRVRNFRTSKLDVFSIEPLV